MRRGGLRRPLEALAQRVLPRVVRWRLRDAYLDRQIRRSGRLAHPDPPTTFTHKVRYKMLNDRRPLLTQWADKVAVRDYVERKLGRDFLTDLYLVTDDAGQLQRDVLPREFALKPSHGSGACVIVGDHVPPDRALPDRPAGWVQVDVAPESLDWGRLRGLCREWLGLPYLAGLEWAYRNVPPRILVEELLLEREAVPSDYRFFVFHGRVRLVQIDMDRFEYHVRNFYSPEWDALPVEHTDRPPGPGTQRPASLGEMIRVAEALGEETDFVRVDLYTLGARIVVGELTNYPWGGTNDFKPASFDDELGAWWTLPKRYR